MGRMERKKMKEGKGGRKGGKAREKRQFKQWECSASVLFGSLRRESFVRSYLYYGPSVEKKRGYSHYISCSLLVALVQSGTLVATISSFF